MADICAQTGRIYQETMSMMKRFSINTLIVIAMTAGLMLSVAELSAQEYVPTPVNVSTNKLKVDGKLCYSHIVLERQTIYSICKAYNVTEEDLYKFNPGLKENGLKKNGILIIPAVSTEAKTVVEEPQKEVAQTVQPQNQNPAPKKAENTKHLKHTVKWYETNINDIAEKYGVTVESIVKLNNLKSTTLTSRQKILIPDPEEQYSTPETELTQQQTASDTTATEQEKVLMFTQKDDVTFALLLPMDATGTSSKRNYMDFYSGVLLGIHNCANEGIGTDLRVYDIAEGNLPEAESLKECDFVIGPVHKADLAEILEASKDSTTIISPLDYRAESLLSKHNSLIQAPTERFEQLKDLVKWVKEETAPQDRIIYISESNARDTAAVNAMLRILKESQMPYSRFSYNILQGRDITEPLLAKITKEGANRFIIESESEAWVNDVVRNLNLLKKEAEIVLYSPSKIRTFETIEPEYFHNISLRVSLSYNINYEAEDVRQFIMKYRALFMTEPTQFAYQGYDLATYFIRIVHKYGKDWESKLTEEEGKMLQATLRFVKKGIGYTNVGIRRVMYLPDGSIIDVR